MSAIPGKVSLYASLLLATIAAVTLGSGLSGCGGGGSSATAAAPTLISIAVRAANSQIPPGIQQQFTATGTYSDGTTRDLTTTAGWTSSAPAVATVSTSGMVVGITEWQTTIQASLGAIGGSTTLKVMAGFASTGNMTVARINQTATLLPNGKVLIVGGLTNSGISATAELYDAESGAFSGTGSMITARSAHTATLLPNGKVLIVGGGTSSGVLASAELYDPASGSFSVTGSMITARNEHTATLLPNGKVLIAGGSTGSGALASAELYDPASGLFSGTGNMTTGRFGHTATLLNNGFVLVAGGITVFPLTTLSSAELYNPASGTFTATGSMTAARELHTATLLNSGKVLLAGGINAGGVGIDLGSAELYDPAGGGTFAATGNMTTTRYWHTATLLNSGKVLIAGGAIGGSGIVGSPNFGVGTAELYDPVSSTFSATGSMTTYRQSPNAALLNSGMVLVAGGGAGGGDTPIASAELYYPGAMTPAGLLSIAVSPLSPSVSVDSTLQFVATGTFTDGSMQRLASALWISSNTSIVTITNDASNEGAASGVAAGNVTITASAGAVSGSTTLIVH